MASATGMKHSRKHSHSGNNKTASNTKNKSHSKDNTKSKNAKGASKNGTSGVAFADKFKKNGKVEVKNASHQIPVRYLLSAVDPKDYPKADRPEVAIAGRSNAGKSSLLNAMTGAKIAKVSQTPGKTRLLNFFDVGAVYRLVDMPGYGYASRSGDEIREWGKMIEMYLGLRGNLFGVILVMDIRREWDEHEEMLRQFCRRINLPMALVLTKADKCNQSELKKNTERLLGDAQIETVFVTSTLNKTGIRDVETFIFNEWGKSGQQALKERKV